MPQEHAAAFAATKAAGGAEVVPSGHLAATLAVSTAPPAWLWHGQEAHGAAHLPVQAAASGHSHPLDAGWCSPVPPLNLRVLWQ